MKKLIAIGAVGIGGVIAFQLLSPERRRRLAAAARRGMFEQMEQMMASLPEDAPPKLIISILPRLRDQNDQIISMLRELNQLIRELREARHEAAMGSSTSRSI